MTDDLDPEPLDPEAGIASAYLDDEATPDEVARVEASPALRARVEALRDLRARIQVDDPPPERVDDHVAVALSAFDEKWDDDRESPASPPGSGVTDLGARRKRRRSSRLPLGAVAAAVVLLALVGVFALVDLDNGGQDVATSADSTSDDTGEDDSAGATESGGDTDSAADAGEAPGAGNGSRTPVDEQVANASRPSFSDTDGLADHIAPLLPGQFSGPGYSATTTGPTSESQDSAADSRQGRCDVVAVSGVDQAAVTLVLPAIVAGEEVTAVVSDAGDSRVVVVDESACEVVDELRR